MEKNQFFYTKRFENINQQGETVFTEHQDSFNLNFVIRSFVLTDGRRLVLLNDFHPEKEQVPVHNKQGKQTGIKNEINTFQSEIYLEEKDSIRFIKVTEVIVYE